MRLAFGLSLILLGALWLASTVGLREPAASQAAHWKNAPAGTQWRRTSHGWQRVDQVLADEKVDRKQLAPTSLDPRVVAALQLLISVLALSLFPVASRTLHDSSTRSRHSEAHQLAAKHRATKKVARGVTA